MTYTGMKTVQVKKKKQDILC